MYFELHLSFHPPPPPFPLVGFFVFMRDACDLINWPIVLRDLKLDIEVDGDISVDTCVVRFIL